MDAISDELWPQDHGRCRQAGRPLPEDRHGDRQALAPRRARADFFPEIRRQIPQLQDWVIKNNLLTLDPGKPLEVRETPLYQRGVAGASIDAPGPYRPKDKTYYNVTPLDGAVPNRPRAACASTTTGSCRS
jgi:hypothetical protein